MSRSSRTRSGPLAARAVAALAVVMALAACTTPAESMEASPGSSAPVAASAGATIPEYSKPISEWPGPEDSVTPEIGKSITILTCGSTGITCVRVANGAAAAAEALGWDADVVDGQSQPTVWNSALNTAIAQGTDAIVLAAVPPAAVARAMDVAKKKQIPVISILNSESLDLVSGAVDHDAKALGKLLADVVAVESEGDAHMLLLENDEFPSLAVRYGAFEEELEAVCAGCSIDSRQQFTLALVAQRLGGTVSSTLATHPDIDYVVQPFDAITPFTQQGIRAANSKAQIIGVGADPPSVQAIGDGSEAASVGTPAEWMGWMGVDALVRIGAGQPVPDYTVPMRVITKESVPGEDGWQGDFDYAAKFKELWGV
jgi:ribose transport system substrate-binding protein